MGCGDRWCLENISELSAPAIGTLTNNQALQVCVESIENNFDMPAWEFLLNAKIENYYRTNGTRRIFSW